MKTYTKSVKGMGLFREGLLLLRLHNKSIDGQVQFLVDQMTKAERQMAAVGGAPLKDQEILIIGPGQSKREMMYLGVNNRVTGIDLDVIADNFSLGAYIHMLRKNGGLRTLKTLTRKVLGVDSRFEKALQKHLGVTKLPRPEVLQMDAAQTTFKDNSFDCIYSFSVFEHLPEPARVLAEAKRVLRPGGVCYISLHLYTSMNGCHDLNVFSNGYEPPHWPHLQPKLKDTVHPNAYLNELRIAEWKAIFCRQMPGVKFEFDTIDPSFMEKMRESISKLRAEGELLNYTDEELLNVNLKGIWRKPLTAED